MVFVKKLIIVILLMNGLTACTNLNPVPNEEEQRKIATAKINAHLGIAYLQRNNVQRAKQKLLLAIDQAPNIPEPWYSMAYFLESTGNIKQAEGYYLKALRVAPTRGDSHNNYGTYLCRTRRYGEAIQQFMLAVKDTAYLTPADAYENAGLCALQMPNRSVARQFFNQALQHDISRPVSLLKLATLDYEKGHYAQAKERLHLFLALATPTQESLILRGKLINKLKEVMEANNTPSRISVTPLKKGSIEAIAKKQITSGTQVAINQKRKIAEQDEVLKAWKLSQQSKKTIKSIPTKIIGKQNVHAKTRKLDILYKRNTSVTTAKKKNINHERLLTSNQVKSQQKGRTMKHRLRVATNERKAAIRSPSAK